MAMLPMGVAIAVVVVARLILMATGAAAINAVSIMLVVGLAIVAALVIRSGREYRRTIS